MPNKTLNDLFHDMLKRVYFAEMQMLESLPRLADASRSEPLRRAFRDCCGNTVRQLDRLDLIFGLLRSAPLARPSEAIRGLIIDDETVIRDYHGSGALDAALIADAQAIARYEIARYAALKSWALQLGLIDVADVLDRTLREKKNADASMSGLAAAEMAPRAAA
jgi:ferritin-like metal-binding protein YciE